MTDSATKQALELTQKLVRTPSQADIDDPMQVALVMQQFLERNHISPNIIWHGKAPLAVVAHIKGAYPGRAYLFDACLDTAPAGDKVTWNNRKPFSGAVKGGWLYGRGSADSKAGAAMFAVLAAEWQQHRAEMAGSLFLCFDLDEHTGRFGGIKAAVRQIESATSLAGAVIGYDGVEKICAGARGFYRAKIHLYGDEENTATERSANLMMRMHESEESDLTSSPVSEFAPPTRTATGWNADKYMAELRYDCRLTPEHTAAIAKQNIQRIIRQFDKERPWREPTQLIDAMESWPPYALPEDHPLFTALADSAAEHLGQRPVRKIAGPSNVGNYLQTRDIPALCGFGVRGQNIHGVNEAFEVASLGPALKSYRGMTEKLFALKL